MLHNLYVIIASNIAGSCIRVIFFRTDKGRVFWANLVKGLAGPETPVPARVLLVVLMIFWIFGPYGLYISQFILAVVQ